MTFIIEYERSKLNLLFVNTGNESRRIWEFHNSWGWNTLTWIIYEISNKINSIKIKKLRNKAWTKNGPTFFEIAPGDRYFLPIDLLDGEWEIPLDVNKLRMETLVVKSILEIPDSPEAKELDVFVGKIESNEIILQPVHQWLLPN